MSGLLIRRAKVSDAGAITRHMADPAVFGGLLQLPYPSEELWQKRLADGAAAVNGDVLLVAEQGGELLGNAGLQVFSQLRRRHVAALGISVSSNAQRQGVGSALMAALCDYADRWAGILRIELTVYTDNDTAIRLYRKFGFEIEGTNRSYSLRDGLLVDVHAMARLHPKPPVLNASQSG